MEEYIQLEQINAAANFIKPLLKRTPDYAIILGSGLGEFVEAITDKVVIPFGEIPEWPKSTVQGHQGKLNIGNIGSRYIFAMQGRAHYYEGHSMGRITLPVRVMFQLGIRNLIVTNAAGAVNPDYQPGDLMLLKDHIGLIAMTGANPLRGPNQDHFGPRFPDMSQPYHPEYRKRILSIAKELEVPLHEGVYVSLSGPSFETPADLRFLRVIGADAVGMSTVPEVITARHAGMNVLGISGISNKANLDGSTITTHEEVLAAGEILVPKLLRLLLGFLEQNEIIV